MTTSNSLLAKNSKIRWVIVGLMVLVALVAAFLIGQGSSSPESEANANTSQTETTETNVAEEVESTARRPAEPIQTVKTNSSDLEMQLDSIVRRDNTVTVNVSYVFIQDKTFPKNPSYKNKLKDAYLVDSATNQKYSVVTDENGDPLVSDIDLTEEFEYVRDNDLGNTMGFYVTLTAPPVGSVVDIFIPGSQALTDIQLN